MLAVGLFVVLRLSAGPEPSVPTAKVPEARLDSQTAAASMAENLALGNPEVLQHIVFQLERDTGCRARVQSHVVDTADRTQVSEERRARAALLAELAAEPTVESASHGSARVTDGTSVFHVVLAVVC